jgi:tetratricopeptide (TPR) repeat protein
MSPLALYGQYAATLMLDPGKLNKYIQREQRFMTSRETRGLDSLRFKAEMIDPFFHRWIEANILVTYALTASRVQGDPFAQNGQTMSSVQGSRNDNSASGQRQNEINTSSTINRAEQYFEETDPYSRGGLYYGLNDLREAIQYYTIALRTRNIDWIWADRARAFYEQHNLDSAITNLQRAIGAPRHSSVMDADPERHVYEDRGAWLYALGRAYEDKRDTARARDAYERSFSENEQYYPSLIRLAALAVIQRDTAMAVGALRRVVEGPLTQYSALAVSATILSQLGKHDIAAAAMLRATQLEPYASAGYMMLGKALQANNDPAGAVAAYEKFLVLAPHDDAMRNFATQALTTLRAAPGQ